MDFTSILKTVAPWIATAVGGPLGGLAVGAACDALGVPEKTTDSLKAALAGVTPEQMLALKQADQNFQVQMQAMGFKNISDLEAIAAGDRDSARKMQMANHSVVPACLTCFLTVATVAIIVFRLTAKTPPQADSLLESMIGSLMTVWLGSCAYWFGTTRNSFDKTQLLAQSTPPAGGPLPASSAP